MQVKINTFFKILNLPISHLKSDKPSYPKGRAVAF